MNEVSSDELSTAASSPFGTGTASLAITRPLLESVDSREGVCDRDATFEEHLDEGDEFKFSSGISSLLTRGLESRDFGVPECERCFEPSRDFEPDGVLIGALEGFDELRRRDDDSLKT
jgi:hypothetical protein